MSLFRRIFLSHLLAIFVTCAAFAAAVGVVSPGFYREQLDSVSMFVTPEWAWLRVTLEKGQRHVILYSLLVAFPPAALLAAGTAYLETRRITSAVSKLAKGSREIARGRYGQRLTIQSRDELAEIGGHFNEMAEALEGEAKNRARMVSAVAHELRTPLANLRSHTEALVDGVFSPEEASYIITREVSILQRITDDLLLVARVEAREVELRLEPQPPEALLADAYERFLHAFEDKGVALELAPTEALPAVRGDRERAHQVLGNLLSNALSYTPPGGRVTLAAQAQECAVRFSVADTGPGISPADQPHVFRRFYRADAARKGGEHRLGVGLTVAEGLVEAMGGRIWLESEAGRGSIFFFTLPPATAEGN
jgi:signal transduction histidine kinase